VEKMDINDPKIHLPVVMAANAEAVRSRFWPKLRRALAHIPFAGDLLAAYYCAMDPLTPVRVKGVLFAALAYFILPADIIPDFIAGLGFTDDLTVLGTAIALVRSHMTDAHRTKADLVLIRIRNAG